MVYEIRPWRVTDTDDVIEMIVTIQQVEFGLSIAASDQPDLVDVDGVYRGSGGEFWVAEHEGAVVGTIAAIGLGDSVVLRKMFVHSDHRGSTGLAGRLIETLLNWARADGFRSVYLGTTAVMVAAHRFYARHGFSRIEPDELPPGFPRMVVDTVFLRRELSG